MNTFDELLFELKSGSPPSTIKERLNSVRSKIQGLALSNDIDSFGQVNHWMSFGDHSNHADWSNSMHNVKRRNAWAILMKRKMEMHPIDFVL